jgi:hypothetical protein
MSYPINSLFVSSYLLKNKKSDLKNIFIYTSPTKKNYKKLTYKENEQFSLCLLPYIKKINKNNLFKYNFGKLISGYSSFFLFSKNKFYSNKIKKEELKLRKFLENKKINIEDITEVYYGWSQLKYILINILRNRVKYVKFEHGCGDVRETVESFSILKNIVKIVKYKLFKNFFYLNKINYSSIFYKNFYYHNSNKKINKITKQSVKKIISDSKKNIKINKNIKGNSLVIMIDYFDKNSLSNPNEAKIISDFFDGMFNLLKKNLKIKINQLKIKNLIIKMKIHSDISSHKYIILNKAKECFSNKLKVYFSDDLLCINYNIEYLINLLKVKIIVSSFSQGQINVKKIFPRVKTYMIDTWYINFWKKYNRENLLHGDYSWLINFYFKKYEVFFKSVLPKRIT